MPPKRAAAEQTERARQAPKRESEGAAAEDDDDDDDYRAAPAPKRARGEGAPAKAKKAAPRKKQESEEEDGGAGPGADRAPRAKKTTAEKQAARMEKANKEARPTLLHTGMHASPRYVLQSAPCCDLAC